MKMKLALTGICLITFATAAAAQSSIKLFDPVAIGASDSNMIINAQPYGMYRSVQVYLSCPTSGHVTSSISGPNGGDLIVDNTLVVNNTGVCSGNCFSSASNPGAYIGMPVEVAYTGVAPINVGRQVRETGLYTFNLLDFGYTYGSSAVYLNTTCSIFRVDTPVEPVPLGDSVVCHRDSGNRRQQTLRVGAASVSAHLSHGDTLGACSQ